ncbi:alpha/beta hydrolase [Ornithinibacillus sp. L9]|uniref:Alpha/beta hydrolase n=1 Tax=Ornithinibacillus caprae TaxID=2678566 RepID=A0A6N8FEM0_9BACI|nr:alpha/beta hydrolase [Ornithinibacillus caprae]MUK87990.1 alpha/beta hydrolase [Ornithinibacillus caprae]
MNEKAVVSKGKELRYTHLVNDSDTVCFMFSGFGYKFDKPLFYYSTMEMLDKGYDIVHVHSSYTKDILKLSVKDISNVMLEDAYPIITEVLKSRKYSHTIIFGKSLGTLPIINCLIKNQLYSDSKLVLLTPLLKFDIVFESLMESSNPSLIIVGEKDPHFIPNKVQALESKTNFVIETIPNANHFLDVEPNDTIASLRAMENMVRSLHEFISGGKKYD